MATRDRLHIFVQQEAIAEPYRRPGMAIPRKKLPAIANRRDHGIDLATKLRDAEAQGLHQRETAAVSVEGARSGVYVMFESFPGIELALEKLDPRQGKVHPELVSVQIVYVDNEPVERAAVWIPEGKLGYFLKRLDQYVETADAEKTRHVELVDRVRSIGLASLEAFWTDTPDEFPSAGERVWWEMWLRRRDDHEIERLKNFAEASEIRVGPQTLGFADRVVVLVEATVDELAGALNVLDDLAELRKPREPASVLALEPPEEQAAWVQQLLDRTSAAGDDAPAACIVDTGVYRLHPLLSQSLNPNDCHACDPTWGTEDHDGHGTEMAGLALYGDFGAAILSGSDVHLRHRLESVKLVPPPPETTPRHLWGAITATGTSLAEIAAPGRRRVFSLATTASWEYDPEAIPEVQLGQPTSWSAAIDALAAGLGIDLAGASGEEGMVFLDESEEAARRLFLISAGNVDELGDDHLDRSDIEPVEDPAQAWNALTVGAFTELDSLEAAPADFDGWTAVAPQGELSPHSRTSVAFRSTWPVKPEIVLEGGNIARSPDGTDYDWPEVMQLLTSRAPLMDQRLLTVTCATSAATAQAAYMGASILAEYPALWPETVRALMVHSAEWTTAMESRFSGAKTRKDRIALYRRYGMGVPSLLRATRSASDALTLIVQDVIHPFDGEGRMREMHLHDLPWPTDVLAELGEAEVRLRVTLSYFIEPNPGRRGWAKRYSYPSHGLRFEVRRPLESMAEFRKRVNQKALAEEEKRPKSEGDAQEWFFGPAQRTSGSVHSDIWTGTAADLAERAAVAVFPVTGWWKERKDRDRSDRGARYALVISIETPEQDVDVWTPVAEQVGIPIEIET